MAYRAFTALTLREIRHWIRSPTAVLSNLAMPIVYLILFGQAMNLGKFLPNPSAAAAAFLGAPNYFSFFSVGMVGFVVLFASLFQGSNVLWDKRLGYLKKVGAAPVARTTIFGAKLVAGAARALFLGAVVFAIALLLAHTGGLTGLTVTASVSMLGILEVAFALVFISLAFTSIFLAFGFLIDSPEAYFGVINLVNLPLLFTSAAMYPRTIMPGWLQGVSDWNPVTLAVNVMRENLFSAAYYAHPPLYYLSLLFLYSIGLFVVGVLIARRALEAH